MNKAIDENNYLFGQDELAEALELLVKLRYNPVPTCCKKKRVGFRKKIEVPCDGTFHVYEDQHGFAHRVILLCARCKTVYGEIVGQDPTDQQVLDEAKRQENDNAVFDHATNKVMIKRDDGSWFEVDDTADITIDVGKL